MSIPFLGIHLWQNSSTFPVPVSGATISTWLSGSFSVGFWHSGGGGCCCCCSGPCCGIPSGTGTDGKVSVFPSSKGIGSPAGLSLFSDLVKPTSKRTLYIWRSAEKTIAAILTWAEEMIANLIIVGWFSQQRRPREDKDDNWGWKYYGLL